MSRRELMIRTLEDCGYQRYDLDWWNDYALEIEYERLTGEQPLIECDDDEAD